MASGVADLRDRALAAARALSFDQRMGASLFLGLALLPLLSHLIANSYLLVIGERVMIFAIAALSLELLIGAGGLLSFGHAAFLGIGAYAGGILASHGLGTMSIALPAALAGSALFALATGAIAVRTRAVYFIMITLAFAQMAYFVAGSLAAYGGDDGLSWPTRTMLLGTQILKHEASFFYLSLALLVATYLGVGRLLASRFGRVLRGLTDNEIRMQAIGFAPYPYRLTAYVIAGSLCGVAGFLLGNQAEFVSPAYMHWQRSGELIIMVLLGGTGTLWGPIAGALAFLMLEETLSRLTEHWKIVLGPALVVMVLGARGGIAGAVELCRQRRPRPFSLAAVWGQWPRRWLRPGSAALATVRAGQPALAQAAICLKARLAAASARWQRLKAALARRLLELARLPAGLGNRGPARWWRR